MGEKKLPRVSIIIANYNNEEYVCHAIQSAYDQRKTYKGNIRVIVIDDGSTDKSVEKMEKEFNLVQPFKDEQGKLFSNANEDGSIVLFTQKNKGPSAARNGGIETVFKHTDLFMILDADDYYLQEKVSKSVAVWQKCEEQIGIVYSDYYISDTRNNSFIIECKEPYDRVRLTQENIIHSGSLVSKTALEKAGLYDEEMRTCEDYDLWMRVTEHFLASHIAEPLLVARTTGKNSTFSVDAEIWKKDLQRVHDKRLARKA